MATEVRLNAGQIGRLLTARNEPVVRELVRRGILVRNAAVSRCPVDTGRLRASITYELRFRAGVPLVAVGSNLSYARAIHDGTGIYGPRGTRIRPVQGSVLAFNWRNAPAGLRPGRGGKFFFRSVRGVRGRPYLRDGLREGMS